MNIASNPTLLELLAASHALGILRGGARRRFERLAREQPAIRGAALNWQGRLASLTELQTPVVPDPAVWIRIRNMIEAEQALQARKGASSPTTNDAEKSGTNGGWFSKLWLWRGTTAIGALATVAAVAVSFALKSELDTAPAIQYVAVLADDKAQPSILVTFDPKNKQLVMQRIGDQAGHQADKSLELWALPPGGAPRPLGTLDSGRGVTLTASSSEVTAPALAISLEPKGGAPKGSGPTGPILFTGPLIEKTI